MGDADRGESRVRAATESWRGAKRRSEQKQNQRTLQRSERGGIILTPMSTSTPAMTTPTRIPLSTHISLSSGLSLPAFLAASLQRRRRAESASTPPLDFASMTSSANGTRLRLWTYARTGGGRCPMAEKRR